MTINPTKQAPQHTRSRLRRLAISTSAAVVGITLFQNGCAGEKPVQKTLDDKRAKTYLDQICKIGRRISGTEGMAKQQKLLADHFREHGAEVNLQQFDLPHPQTGKPTRFANMIVTWHPKATKRILIACHYDTRPFPDQDRRNPKGLFIGANDGASGVALMMEMAHHMKNAKTKYGVDFVLFDGEELIYPDPNRPDWNDMKNYFLGSTHFAKQYRDHPPKHRYVAGVLVDMVAGRNLKIFMERNSLKMAPEVTRSIWKVAASLRVREFIRREKHDVNDDHIPLNMIAKIPTCDLIDFDYPHWHTTRDVPAKCSGRSLEKVGRVLMKWIEEPPGL